MNLCSAIAINGKALPGFSLVWRYNASEEGRMFTVPLDGSATADRAELTLALWREPSKYPSSCSAIETDGDFSAEKARYLDTLIEA